MGPIGWPEIILILIVLLLVFGAKRLPEMGRSMGRGMREFKDAVTGIGSDTPTNSSATPQDSTPAELPPASAEPPSYDKADADEKERETVS
jgi:sec-independent protein translocase protein TatA